MYELTLTAGERQAIDWIGDRYFHGHELWDLLTSCSVDGADPCEVWSDEGDVTFLIPEHVAWAIRDGFEAEGRTFDCLGEELTTKLTTFLDSII